MQVKEIETAGLKHKYEISVPTSTIQDEVEAELKVAGKQVKIPGFRPGFVPMKILKQRYGQSVEADVLKKVIQNSTAKLISDKKLRPAFTPDVNVENYAENKDLVFTAAFEVFPPMPEVDFSSITLERKTFEITEEDIEKSCDRIAENSPEIKPAPADKAAESGNVVEIDFVGKMNGEEFEGGSAEKFRLELGSGQFIEGFEDQLVGIKAGEERTVNVTFPKQYQSESLAGKEASFDVKVHQVLVKEKPVMDDEFAKARGFADVKALREAVRNQMTKEYDQLVRSSLKKQLFDELEETLDMELPERMVTMEFDNIWERLKQAQAEGDASLAGKSDDELKKEYQEIAKRRVKLGIFLAEVSNANKLEVGREELGRAAIQQASMFPGQERKVMEFYRENPERLEDLRGPILEEKAVDFILTKTAYNDSKVTLDELAQAEDESENSSGKATKKKSTKAKTSAKKAKKDEE